MLLGFRASCRIQDHTHSFVRLLTNAQISFYISISASQAVFSDTGRLITRPAMTETYALLSLFLLEPLLPLAGCSGKKNVGRAVERSLGGVLENSDDEADSDNFHGRIIVDSENGAGKRDEHQ